MAPVGSGKASRTPGPEFYHLPGSRTWAELGSDSGRELGQAAVRGSRRGRRGCLRLVALVYVVAHRVLSFYRSLASVFRIRRSVEGLLKHTARPPEGACLGPLSLFWRARCLGVRGVSTKGLRSETHLTLWDAAGSLHPGCVPMARDHKGPRAALFTRPVNNFVAPRRQGAAAIASPAALGPGVDGPASSERDEIGKRGWLF